MINKIKNRKRKRGREGSRRDVGTAKEQEIIIDRRSLLRALAAAPLLLGAAPAARAQGRSKVLVIGAGLSGLTAATTLQDEGIDVRVIEGRKRVGGRVYTLRDVPGKPETGGTGASPAYARWVDTAQSLGVALNDMTPILPYLFKRELVLGNKIIPAESWPAHPRNPFPEHARAQMPWQYVSRVIRQGNPLETFDDWLEPANSYLDIPLYNWLVGQGLTDQMIELGYNTNIVFGSSAHDISALTVLGNDVLSSFQQRFVESSGVAGYRVIDGIQSIPEALAATLKHEVELDKDVIGIRSHDTGVEVHCADGTVYRSDRVVCSVPISVLRRVAIDPVLGGRQAKLVRTLAYQHMALVHMVAKEPFWDTDGLTPNMFTDGPAGMVLAQRRGATPDMVTSLSAWVSGSYARWLDQLNKTDAKAAVLAYMERIRPAAKGKLDVVAYKSWSRDPFAGGTWAVWGPGQISELAGAVAQPHGRIHFCGEHTSVTDRGMEGALESGERVALEVLELI